jgi:endonuclease/exonuclease/phosphatase (EEP) superfamily protein YafD
MDNLYGMHLYSSLPIKEYSVHYLVKEGIPSIEALIRLPCGKDVRLFCLHPEPPSPSESETSTPRDAELLIVGKKVSNSSEPVLICGDLNDVAWSNTTRLFQKISGLRDPRVGRGFFNTFHTRYPFFRWPLDHIFLSAQFKLIHYKRLPHIGSDHFPIYTAVYLGKTEAEAENLPEAEAEDQKRARKKIKKADPLRRVLRFQKDLL